MDNFTEGDFPFPPRHWSFFCSEWPTWQVNLWHEVVHQCEDHIVKQWSPGNQHGESWRKAMEYVAGHFGITSESLCKVVEGAPAPCDGLQPVGHQLSRSRTPPD